MLKNNHPRIFDCQTEYEQADIVVFGAPFDSTTSYRPGARFGPKEIRSQSFGFEDYSPYQDACISDFSIYDGGDIELPMGDTRKTLDMVSQAVDEILNQDKFPLMLGGEHLLTLPALESVHKKYEDICLIQFDAHADLRDSYLEVRLSHACVIRRAWDLLGKGKIFQFGIRSGDKLEFDFASDETNGIYTEKFTVDSLEQVKEIIKDRPVYFTIDLDVLDPSVLPGTGTPEAGGISYLKLQEAMVYVIENFNVRALDMCELSPPNDISGISTAAACKLLREALIAFGKKVPQS